MLELDLVDMLANESKNDYLHKDNGSILEAVVNKKIDFTEQKNQENKIEMSNHVQTPPENQIMFDNGIVNKINNRLSIPNMNSQNISINWTPEGLSLFLPVQSNVQAVNQNKTTFSEPTLVKEENEVLVTSEPKISNEDTPIISSSETVIVKEKTELENKVNEMQSQLNSLTQLIQNLTTQLSNSQQTEELEEEVETEESKELGVEEVLEEPLLEEVENETNTKNLNEEENSELLETFKLLKVADFDLYAESLENAKEIFDYLPPAQLKIAALSLYQATYKRKNGGSLEGAYI